MRASPRVEALLGELSVEEKASLTIGSDAWHTAALPHRGVGRVKVTDGPTGARGDARSGARATCFPVGVCLGSSWSTELLAEVGAALAGEAQTKAAHVLLGPTVNLQRTPIGGRNFECYSEDPLLTARLAVAFIGGVQGGGVGTSIKHFVGNDVEHDRHHVSTDMDERTLREVALLPFELAVRQVDPWTVMAAYNRVNGEHATSSHWLLTELLKEEWGWPGTVVSDWGAVTETAGTALAGCDLEMPGPVGFLGSRLAEAVRAGEVPEAALDDLARRVLHLAERVGRLDDGDEPPEASVDSPELRSLTRRAAVEGMVLLSNDGVLPLDRTAVTKVAVLGPNAAEGVVQGGGSSQVLVHGEVVGPLDAIRHALGPAVEVVHEAGCSISKYAPNIPGERWLGGVGSAAPGLSSMPFARVSDDGPVLVELFDGDDLGGAAVRTHRASDITTTFFGRLRPLADPKHFSGRFTGTYVPAETGSHVLGLSVVGRGRLLLDGVEVIDAWTDPQPGDSFFGNGCREVTAAVDLVEGRPVEVVLEYRREDSGAELSGVRLGVHPPAPDDRLERAVAAAAAADVAIVVVGTTAEWESEGNDRSTMALPGRQSELLEAVAAANPRTVAVVNAGSPVDTGWAQRCGAVLQVWFGGQEMGPALAAVLLGDADPGGRLPHTVPVRLEDHPAAGSYPGRDGHLPYDEGILAGHRWYDARDIEPRFPFGHGLSYASFNWGAPAVEERSAAVTGPAVRVVVSVTNTAGRAGHEVVQVYVRPPVGSGRPDRELKGFAKLHLDPGTTGEAVVDLDEVAFRHWDISAGCWVVAPGRYEILVAASSRDIRSAVPVDLA
ncbi:MAG: glycoside hydrolase family 3 C-terminal domain-containing protein [Actinomycetota bacterium]|nr:glycoside hydrolase family 3 C-terminal domain-containing protein [Actinomycetota bacterium]